MQNLIWDADTFPCVIQVKLIFKCTATACNLEVIDIKSLK